jgi:hypothetical protein
MSFIILFTQTHPHKEARAMVFILFFFIYLYISLSIQSLVSKEPSDHPENYNRDCIFILSLLHQSLRYSFFLYVLRVNTFIKILVILRERKTKTTHFTLFHLYNVPFIYLIINCFSKTESLKSFKSTCPYTR